MKFFLEMIEHVQRTKTIFDLTKKSSIPLPPQEIENFFAAAAQAECLVFHPKNKEPSDLELKYTGDVHFDAPFSIFSMEILGGNITQPSAEDTFASAVWIHAVLLKETAPQIFDTYFYATFGSNKVVCKDHRDGVGVRGVDLIVTDLVARLNRESVGSETIRQRVKIGSGKNKQLVTFRRIVHIAPTKRTRDSLGESLGRTIEFSHRFVRRGSWVKLPGRVGKNRAGDYCVPDWTWRNETIVGDDDKPLIRKMRVVKDQGLVRGPAESSEDGLR